MLLCTALHRENTECQICKIHVLLTKISNSVLGYESFGNHKCPQPTPLWGKQELYKLKGDNLPKPIEWVNVKVLLSSSEEC